MDHLPVEERVERFGRRFAPVRFEYVGGFKDQITRALIENARLVLAAKPVEDREPDAHQRNIQRVRRLPTV